MRGLLRELRIQFLRLGYVKAYYKASSSGDRWFGITLVMERAKHWPVQRLTTASGQCTPNTHPSSRSRRIDYVARFKSGLINAVSILMIFYTMRVLHIDPFGLPIDSYSYMTPHMVIVEVRALFNVVANCSTWSFFRDRVRTSICGASGSYILLSLYGSIPP